MVEARYKNLYGREDWEPGKELPVISTNIDSVRVYQWEVHLFGAPVPTLQKDFTLAAKQVDAVGYGVDAIEVHRVNDKLYYPGKPSLESIRITFDNLYLYPTSEHLWNWFKNTYDPVTGDMTKNASPGAGSGKTFKAAKMDVVLLDNKMIPHSVVQVHGVWPVSWKATELNYSENNFHTIEVDFRFDFMDFSESKSI
tara:strand:- start:1069 stop:1659 length:591 start_codon:yes stop_codon:yes gene_type:complete